MRKLLIALLVLALLAVAADVLARNVAEDQVAERMQKTFDLADKPSVSVRGIPFLFNIIKGEIPAIVVSGERVRSEDVQLDDVSIRVENVRFSLADVIDGSGNVRASGGSGSASVSADNLNDALDDAGAPFRVELSPGSVTAVAGEGATVQADVAVENNALSFQAEGVAAVALDLPSLGGNLSYESLDVQDGSVSLEFSVRALSLRP